MHNRAMLNPGVRPTRSEATARHAAEPERQRLSTFRALQTVPLARLAANGTEHAHVRAVAILGYN